MTKVMTLSVRRLSSALLMVLLALAVLGVPVHAQTIRVGLAVANSFEFLPVQAEPDLEAYRKRGLDIEVYAFPGDSRMVQALVAGSLDIGLHSTTSAAFIEQGAPFKYVAQISDSLNFFVLVVRPDITDVSQLKGTAIGITSPGSITDVLVQRLAASQGWEVGTDITPMPLGGLPEQVAALKRGITAGFVWTMDAGFEVEGSGDGKLLMNFGPMMGDFPLHMISARNDFVKENPDLVQRFVDAFFESVEEMRRDRARTMQLTVKYQQFSPFAAARVYEHDMDNFSKTGGQISMTGLQNVANVLQELGVLSQPVQDVSNWVHPGFTPANRN